MQWLIAPFVGATALVTVPNLLLECRYFILPFLLWRLRAATTTATESYRARVCVELAFNCVINALSVYLFLHRPFTWSHEAGTQRFMW